jgi:hypothetical protein
MGSVRKYLTSQLKLTVNEDKSQVARSDEISFLGFVFKGTRILWSDKAYKEFRRRVRKYTGRSWFVSMQYRLNKLSTYFRGWMGYFGISEGYRDIPEIDSWIRRRVRLCYWIEHGYQQLKEELGLDHHEGRSWTGWHRHVLLTFLAYGYLTQIRLEQKKQKSHRFWDKWLQHKGTLGKECFC